MSGKKIKQDKRIINKGIKIKNSINKLVLPDICVIISVDVICFKSASSTPDQQILIKPTKQQSIKAAKSNQFKARLTAINKSFKTAINKSRETAINKFRRIAINKSRQTVGNQ